MYEGTKLVLFVCEMAGADPEASAAAWDTELLVTCPGGPEEGRGTFSRKHLLPPVSNRILLCICTSLKIVFSSCGLF